MGIAIAGTLPQRGAEVKIRIKFVRRGPRMYGFAMNTEKTTTVTVRALEPDGKTNGASHSKPTAASRKPDDDAVAKLEHLAAQAGEGTVVTISRLDPTEQNGINITGVCAQLDHVPELRELGLLVGCGYYRVSLAGGQAGLAGAKCIRLAASKDWPRPITGLDLTAEQSVVAPPAPQRSELELLLLKDVVARGSAGDDRLMGVLGPLLTALVTKERDPPPQGVPFKEHQAACDRYYELGKEAGAAGAGDGDDDDGTKKLVGAFADGLGLAIQRLGGAPEQPDAPAAPRGKIVDVKAEKTELPAHPAETAAQAEKVVGEPPAEEADAAQVLLTLVAADRKDLPASKVVETLTSHLSDQGLKFLTEMTVDGAKKYVESLRFSQEVTERLCKSGGLIENVIAILRAGV